MNLSVQCSGRDVCRQSGTARSHHYYSRRRCHPNYSLSDVYIGKHLRQELEVSEGRPRLALSLVTPLDRIALVFRNNPWQGWLEEDRTFLSVNENAILGDGAPRDNS